MDVGNAALTQAHVLESVAAPKIFSWRTTARVPEADNEHIQVWVGAPTDVPCRAEPAVRDQRKKHLKLEAVYLLGVQRIGPYLFPGRNFANPENIYYWCMVRGINPADNSLHGVSLPN